jgi:hypothetical protein
MSAVCSAPSNNSGGDGLTGASTAPARSHIFSAQDQKMLGLCPILVRHIFAELEENPGSESPSLDVCLLCGLTLDKRGREQEEKAEEELAGVGG